MHILFIDDDPLQQKLIGAWLKEGGHSFEAFDTQASFLQALPTGRFDLLLVDWLLPVGSGAEIVGWVRKNLGWKVPLMVLTAHEDEETVVSALQAGADDYVLKRAKPAELMARINTVLRHVNPSALPTVSLSVYQVDLVQQRLMVDKSLVSLTQKEFDLAAYLLQNPDKLLSRDHLLQKIWGMDNEADTRTVDTHISRLRKKLQLDGTHGWGLSPIYGFGYRLEPKALATPAVDA
jgi:two-component system response regulator RegX3